VNLRLSDRSLGTDPGHVLRLVSLVRAARPRAVAVPYWVDRHPDHVAASHLLTDAVFNAGLRRYQAEGDAWKPDSVCYYFINDSAPPSFVVDVSATYEIKRRALACHASQFQASAPEAVATRLTSPRFSQLIESRDAQFGALAGVAFAEGVIVKDLVVRPHLFRDLDR
jgi:bacillithiol biosynthesis deacetylase BshB1